jgi:streptogrisin D
MPLSGVHRGTLIRALTVLALALAALLAAPGARASAPRTPSPAERDAAVASMVRELGVAPDEAARRLEAQDRLAGTAERLGAALGERAAGTWIDPATGALKVNVLDDDAAERVRAAGAQPNRVAHSLPRLEQAQATLDGVEAVPGMTWAVDVPSNSLVVGIPQGQADARSDAFLATARTLGVPVQVEQTAGPAATQAFYGGEAILASGGGRCSAGFITQSSSGNQYVVTAGHCTDISSSWSGDGQTIGSTAASSFPGNDYGAIRINDPSALQAEGAVLSNGSPVDITSAGRVPVGSTVCKTGSTTGTTCGQVLRYDATVNYAEGSVGQLTEANVCTEPGDSGGPLFAGGQAQGVVSGGSTAGCGSSGFRSYFQPVDEVLSTYGLTLR